MEQEILSLRKQLAFLRVFLVVIGIGMIALLWKLFVPGDGTPGVLRARGIVIEDSAGRDRILIGAPFPASPHRVRTDSTLARKAWAGNFEDPDQYMQWYRDYYHGGTGILVMNEQGFDRVLVGDKLADPNTGKRMFEPAGILWNDRMGFERGGAGVNTTKDGQARSVIGVDAENGEAAHIIALEDGTNAIAIRGDNGMLLIGLTNKGSEFFQTKEAFTGMKFFTSDGKLAWELPVGRK
jgi:hypothetical protein